MTLTRQVLFVVAAVVCFIVAFLIAINSITGNEDAFAWAGLGFFAAGHLP